MVDKIITLIKEKGLNVSTVEKQLGFGNGSIKRFKTNSPSIDKITKISNFLNVSVDYLLGLSDNPNIQLKAVNNQSNNSITNTGIIKGNNSANLIVGNNNTYKSDNETKKQELSKQALELAEIFDNLGIREQNEILSAIFEIEDRNKKR